MNDIFQFKRFRLYFIKTVLERPAQILGTFALSFSVVILVYLLFKFMGNIGAGQFMSFAIGLVGGGCLLASQVFGYFADAASSASYLTFPVSAFEKWLCGFLLVGIIYLGLFLLFFRGLDSFFVHLYHNSLNRNDARYQDQYDSVYVYTYFGESLSDFIFFFNASAAMMVGSLYFNKVSFIKVALVICSIYFFTFMLNYVICSILFKDLQRPFPFHNIEIKNGNDWGVIAMPSAFNKLYDMLAIYILPTVLLVISFIRLREKEV
jgi:hypothetical protein